MKTLILFIFFTQVALAIKVSNVDVKCNGSVDCENVTSSFKSLRRTYSNLNHLKRTVKLYVLNKGISHFSYRVLNNQDDYAIEIDLVLKKPIGNVEITGIEDIEIPTILPVVEGGFYDKREVEETKAIIENVMISKGFPSPLVKIASTLEEDEYNIEFKVKRGRSVKLKNFEVFSESYFLKDFVVRAMKEFEGENFDLQRIKNKLESLRQLFISFGYYLVTIDISSERKSSRVADVKVSIRNADLFVTDFKLDNTVYTYKELKDEYKTLVLSFKREITKENIIKKMKELYQSYGYDRVSVSVKNQVYRNINGDKVIFNIIDVKQGERRKLSLVEFRRLAIKRDKKLRRLFYERAPSVVKSGYYDPEYVLSFPELIKDFYIQKGYLGVFVETPKPQVVNEEIRVSYRIKEGVRSLVSKIRFKGVPDDLSNELLKLIQTKINSPFDPTVFKSDIETIEETLLDRGYYNSRVTNKLANSLVDYKKDTSTVNINFDVNLGKKIYVDKIIIVGNRKTRSKLIRREILLREDDIITKSRLQQSQTSLLGLGLFSSVVIKPVQNVDNSADLLIIVREKNFGLIELAPGVRTDIGLKFSADISYNNIDGLNKRVSFKGQVNQRFNLNSLDEQRRENSNSLIEYNLIANYSENYLFDYDVKFATSLSNSRQRFFSFDADITRVNFTFSHSFTDWFSVSTRYQFETINQFEATQDIDEGTFQIGAITPALTFDFRDNRINPQKGAWFNLSYEAANPNFLSQSNDELTIDYFKIVSRNRFYAPINNGVLAVSLAAGLQQNLATDKRLNDDGNRETEGFIPNIKVFRLNGVDNVRGYEDNEINTLVTGEDVSEARVDDKAYMAVIKIEPRFFLSDTSMFGVFYDAGRVFVDEYDTSKLKSSVGITFKYLTPVGSLDFDYGIKLLRKNDDGDRFDSPGRLHVSIGFF